MLPIRSSLHSYGPLGMDALRLSKFGLFPIALLHKEDLWRKTT